MKSSIRFIKPNRSSIKTNNFSSQINKDTFWLPFTNNRSFKISPKLFDRAEGVYFYLKDGKKIIDSSSGLWCVNAGHGQKKITQAIKDQLDKMDYAPCFNVAHELPYLFSEKLLNLVPNRNFGQVFFTMCGSTAVDTSLKIALAYHRSKGNSTKIRFIGRERGYHGVGFGGISVGGIMPNRKAFSGALLPHIDHLSHTHSLKDMAFSRGLPKWGGHLADELERLVTLHDASSIAAVIVEPVAGSTGVLPPPEGYLKRLREICTKHDILLIFDEVITGFGRLGASFATTKFDVTPDMIACAKGLTNASIPAGAVICQKNIYESILQSAENGGSNNTIEFFHGYTYSGHPLAMAAGLATLEVYEEQQLFQKANDNSLYFENILHELKSLPNVIDIRNIGLMGAVEFEPIPGHPTKRAIDIFERCFEKGMLIRITGSTVAFSPPLISERHHLDTMVNILADAVIESNKFSK